jgi:hypothetical protein
MQLKDCPHGVYEAIYEGNTQDSPNLLATLDKRPPFPLALLRNIKFNGEIIEGHDWQPLWGAIEVADISPGEKIQFLAMPRWYPKAECWQTGLSQVCWVQRADREIECLPVFSPPLNGFDAGQFLSSRLSDPFNDSAIRVAWKDSTLEDLIALISMGLASFAPSINRLNPFRNLISRLEDQYRQRTVQQLCDIAAFCNTGSVACDRRVGGGEYRLCSAFDFLSQQSNPKPPRSPWPCNRDRAASPMSPLDIFPR